MSSADNTLTMFSLHTDDEVLEPRVLTPAPWIVGPQDDETQELTGYLGWPEDALAAFGPDEYWGDGPFTEGQEEQDEDDEGFGVQELQEPPQLQLPAPILPRPRYPDTTWTAVPVLNVRAPGYDLDEEDRPDPVPAGLAEHPGVRMAYLQAVIQNVYAHASVVQATEILNSTLDALSTMGPLPLNPRPVRTLESAKRRLGIDADQYITKYAICPICWKHYTPKQITELDGPECLVDDCEGILYEEYHNRKGHLKRKPIKLNPYTSVVQTLKRFFMRPGFANMVRDNRTSPHGHGDDDDFIMRDIYDAACWDSCYTNTRRDVGNHGSIRDVPCEGPSMKNLNAHRFGLHLTVNTDW